jgi:hypothetical protein
MRAIIRIFQRNAIWLGLLSPTSKQKAGVQETQNDKPEQRQAGWRKDPLKTNIDSVV